VRLESLRTYAGWARDLSSHYHRPLPGTIAKLLTGRVLFGRGPHEFNEYRFALKPVWEWRHYVIERQRRRMQRDAAPECFRSIEEDKVRFWERCVDHDLPTVPITAVILRGHATAFEGRVPAARSGAELCALLEPLADFEGFAKPLGGGQGYGAFTFTVRGGIIATASWTGSAQDLFDHCTSSRFGRAGYLLQPRLHVHPDLAEVMPGPGLGTIRLVTFLRPDANITIPWAVMKIPAPGQIVCHPRLGALMVPVDMQSGRLGTAVGPTADSPVVREHEIHPLTGRRFADTVVPGWLEIIGLLRRAARAFQELPCLGWDVAVAEQGPVLIETNWGFGIHSQQAALNRGLRSELRRHFASCKRR
jgi:hypothetical protein